MSTISISIEDGLRSEIEQNAKAMNLDFDGMIRKALADYFHLRRVESIRKKMNKRALELGFKSEEDIFEAVS
ncbi:MAG: hypothetical protein ACK4Q5_07600 [Saprospiraceae bacterium]